MSGVERFPGAARTHAEIRRYYRNRAVQALPWGWRWDGRLVEHPWGGEVVFRGPDGTDHASVYVLAEAVGKGWLTRWVAANPGTPFVTSVQCSRVCAWLAARGVSYATVEAGWPDEGFAACYRAVEAFYGDERARRSGRFKMAHIDEGLFVLRELGASVRALGAWCLHPLVQEDGALVESLVGGRLEGLPAGSVAVAMAYRERANAHLSRHPPKRPDPGPVGAVRAMLIADKVQNRKDFERYLRGRADVPNAERLEEYFAEWFDALGVTEERYAAWVGAIGERTGGR